METWKECVETVMDSLCRDRGEEALLGWRKLSSTRLPEDSGKTAFASQTADRSKDVLADNFLLGELAEIGEGLLKTFF